MTTKVTIDAHAGWPVLVEYTIGEPGVLGLTNRKEIVPAKTQKDFYIHSGMFITRVMELNNAN